MLRSLGPTSACSERGGVLEQVAVYPPPQHCVNLFRQRLWSFTERNPNYGRLVGAQYALLFLAVGLQSLSGAYATMASAGRPGGSTWAAALFDVAQDVLVATLQSAPFWVVGMAMGTFHHALVVSNAPSGSMARKCLNLAMCVVHTALHVLAAALCRIVIAIAVALTVSRGPFGSLATLAGTGLEAGGLQLGGGAVVHDVASLVLCYAGAYWVGPYVLVSYLHASFTVLGEHWNEAYSTLSDADTKSFLRMHVRADGNLELFCIGIPRVPRRWRRVPMPGRDERPVEPARGEDLRYELVDYALFHRSC